MNQKLIISLLVIATTGSNICRGWYRRFGTAMQHPQSFFSPTGLGIDRQGNVSGRR